MQNPWWQRCALLGMAGITSVLLGCAEHSSPVAQSTTPAAGVAASMDWEMQWAQAALERNPNLEILSADREQRSFTVRDRATTMTTQVQLAQLAAAPIEFLTLPSPTQANPAPAEPEHQPAIAAPAEPQAPALLAQASDATGTERAAAPRSPSYVIERSNGRTRVVGDGISVVYGDAPTPDRDPAQVIEPALHPDIEPSRGRLRISAPGISIEPSDPPDAAPVLASEAGTEAEPVICEGPRVMQLDSRKITVDGDALTARGGCELYITNSTIVASGTAVVIGDATVHINNSRIAGRLASFDATDRAKVFLRGSTLNGVPRRNARALVQDQGGNSYQ